MNIYRICLVFFGFLIAGLMPFSVEAGSKVGASSIRTPANYRCGVFFSYKEKWKLNLLSKGIVLLSFGTKSNGIEFRLGRAKKFTRRMAISSNINGKIVSSTQSGPANSKASYKNGVLKLDWTTKVSGKFPNGTPLYHKAVATVRFKVSGRSCEFLGGKMKVDEKGFERSPNFPFTCRISKSKCISK